MRLVLNTTSADGANSVRLAKDPRNDTLYYSKFNGDIYKVTLVPAPGSSSSSKLYTAADHGISDSAQGMAIGPDGTIYLVGNTTTNSGNSTFATIMKGVPEAAGNRAWSLLAKTEPYPRSRTAFDHSFNGVVVSPDGTSIYVNSGARTDHGEVQSAGGVFPDTRDVPLTAKILRLPANASNLLLLNDINALRNAGYVYAEGTRNSFDLAFAPGGDLFATENGPDRDMSDELNWLRPGLHYGFPWRMGAADNPQQFPNYDPSTDRLLDSRFISVFYGYYHNDPTFPPPPTNFAEPVVNIGPDADKYRDPGDGSIKDASALGQTLGTFTAHRSPLGLSFDRNGAMAPPFLNHGFMLSFTPGDATGNSVPGPFFDPGQDLVDLGLTKLGSTNFQARVTRIAGGFSTPIDSEIIGNRLYVLEYSGNQGLWEITFPPARAALLFGKPVLSPDGTLTLTVTGSIPEQNYEIQWSANLVDWLTLTNVTPLAGQFQVTDHPAGNSRRFYRVVQRP